MSETNVFNYDLIIEIIVCKDEKMIAVKHLHVTHFDRMLCAFQVQYSDDSNTHLIPLSSLYCHGALALQNKRGKKY